MPQMPDKADARAPMTLESVQAMQEQALRELEAARDAAALEAWKRAWVGPSGALKNALAGLRDVPKDQRPAVGQRLNDAKKAVEDALAARGDAPAGGGAKADQPLIDVTEPGIVDTRGLGRRHVLMRVREELCEVFARMGFEVATGPELEDDDHNFVKLNIPEHHPARDPQDNFYVDDPRTVPKARMLRSQTSTVQVRVMERAVREGGGKLSGPIRVISPGRVYRPDTVDATHSFMFHQMEGLLVDRGVTMSDLRTTLLQFARAYFGPGAQVRLRPSFFPFTEPSAELDMLIALREGEKPRWIELGGCGMVDPAVFTLCGIDPEEWTGFAFGFGIERLAMGKYAIPDIRLLFENDVRFLERI